MSYEPSLDALVARATAPWGFDTVVLLDERLTDVDAYRRLQDRRDALVEERSTMALAYRAWIEAETFEPTPELEALAREYLGLDA